MAETTYNVFDWSPTAASNNMAVPEGAPENMNRTDVNDVVREHMAVIRKTLINALPWLEMTRGETITKVDDTNFRVETGGDHSGIYTVNRQVKIVGTSTVYGYISVVAYAPPNTTVTVVVDGDADVPGSITEVHVSCVTDLAGLSLSEQLETQRFEGVNGVKDSSFEDNDLSKWTTVDGGATGWSIVSDPHAGAKACQFDITSQSGSAYLKANYENVTDRTRHIPCSPGDRFAMRVFAKRTGSGGAFVSLGIEFFDEAGASKGSSFDTDFAVTASYAEYSFTSTVAPADSVYCVPQIRVLSGSPASTIYVFDCFTANLVVRSYATEDAGVMTDITAAGTITPSGNYGFFTVTGTTSISTITAAHAGRRLTLLFRNGGSNVEGNTIAFNDVNPDTIVRTAGSFLSDGFQDAETVTVVSRTGTNDGSYLIDTVAAGAITMDAGVALTTEAADHNVVLTTPGCAVLETGNIKLVAAFTSLRDSVLILESDGTDWFEIARVHRVEVRKPGTIPTMAFATGELTLPTWTAPYRHEYMNLTGALITTSIAATGNNGRIITFINDSATGDFNDANNLKIAGLWDSNDNDTITLVCDGTNWYEISRSAN